MDAVTRPVALAARGVHASLGAARVLHDIDLSVEGGRWTSIVGPNGAGKSTLLKVLAGLIDHTGEVMLFDQPLASLPGRARARQISWLGQNENAADDLNAYDVTMLGRLPHQPWLAAPGEADHAAVREALGATQAWAWRDRPLGQMSGGERQRVLLARALAVQAGVLLMDEPLANLDPPHQTDWLLIVRELVAAGRTVVSVLHEISLALQADDMVVMAGGRIRHQGSCSDAATHTALQEVFDHRITVHHLQGQWLTLPDLARRERDHLVEANSPKQLESECASTNWQVVVGASPIRERKGDPS